MITPPQLPTAAELKRAEEVVVGSAKELLEIYYISRQNYERRLDDIYIESRRNSRHIRLYRYFSVLSGMLLAVASLALCAFGIDRHADLIPLAAVLGPIAGLAGIFIWGYRPISYNDDSKRKFNINIAENA